MENSKIFTGDKEIYLEMRNHLVKEGFNIAGMDTVHIGKNRYEFQESFSNSGLGCHDVCIILAWKDGDEIKYKAKVTGFCCND